MNEIIKDPKTGKFLKGNCSATKDELEKSRQVRAEKKRKKLEERKALVKRVRAIRGENLTLDDIEGELTLSDGLQAIKRVEDLYKRLMFESLLLEDIDWNDPAARSKRKDILTNLKALSSLIKEFANLQQIAKIWEGVRNVPRREQDRFDSNVVDFIAKANEKVAKAEKASGRN